MSPFEASQRATSRAPVLAVYALVRAEGKTKIPRRAVHHLLVMRLTWILRRAVADDLKPASVSPERVFCGAALRRFARRAPADDDANVTMLSRVLWVGLGGMAGSVARYLLSDWLTKAIGPTFPFGTLAVNLIGSLLLGAIMAIAVHTTSLSPGAQLGLTTGVMGGFTTYSTFNFETLRLLEERAWALAGLYVGATLFGCLAVGWLGWQGTAWLLALAKGR